MLKRLCLPRSSSVVSAFASLLFFAHPDVADASAHTEAARRIEAARAGAHWDRRSLVEADFNGDARADFAMAGYSGDELIVALRLSSGPNRVLRNHFLGFRIDSAVQAGVCAVPVRLMIEPLVCAPAGAPLPGCRASRSAQALRVEDGECDALHLYWDDATRRVRWWRN